MSLSSLPSVLAQSIAHFLTTEERLGLARCSRQHRLLAQAPFAWLGADPLTIEFDGNNLSSSPLLRFIPVSLVWGRYVEADSIPRTVCNVIAIADRIHLVALQLCQLLDDASLSQLLQPSSLKRLQSLTLWSHRRSLIELACQLPLLTSLTLRCPLAEDEAALLSTAPSLTDLTVSHPHPGCLSAVLHCPKLRRLTVYGFRWSDLRSFSQGLCVPQLRELSLTGSFDRRVSSRYVEVMDAALSGLRSLLVLTLGASDLDPLLTHVHRIPTLRRLVIECRGWEENLHCSEAVMLSLLRSVPSLCVDWLVDQSIERSLHTIVAAFRVQLILIEGLSKSQSRLCVVRAATPRG